MADNKQRIANKIFKVLPMYEEDFGVYYKYLTRIIIELQGEDHPYTGSGHEHQCV